MRVGGLPVQHRAMHLATESRPNLLSREKVHSPVLRRPPGKAGRPSSPATASSPESRHVGAEHTCGSQSRRGQFPEHLPCVGPVVAKLCCHRAPPQEVVLGLVPVRSGQVAGRRAAWGRGRPRARVLSREEPAAQPGRVGGAGVAGGHGEGFGPSQGGSPRRVKFVF